MKHIIVLMLLTVSIGCENEYGSHGRRFDGAETEGKFSKVEFEGHSYILYVDGSKGNQSRIGGITHNPQCSKCKQQESKQ